MIGIIESKRGKKNTVSNPYVDAVEIFSLRKIEANPVIAGIFKREADGALENLLFDSGFISMKSKMSNGQTLEDWANGGTILCEKLFGQKGFKDLVRKGPTFSLVTNGVLNTINGKPALEYYGTSRLYQRGLEATKLNGGNRLGNTSIFSVCQYGSNVDTNRAYGWGSRVTNEPSDKRNLNPAADNSFRFDGGFISGTITPDLNPMIRSSFKNGDTYIDYINNVENINSVLTGTSIVDDFFVGCAVYLGNANFKWSESIVYLTDESSRVNEIQDEQNNAFQIY